MEITKNSANLSDLKVHHPIPIFSFIFIYSIYKMTWLF